MQRPWRPRKIAEGIRALVNPAVLQCGAALEMAGLRPDWRVPTEVLAVLRCERLSERASKAQLLVVCACFACVRSPPHLVLFLVCATAPEHPNGLTSVSLDRLDPGQWLVVRREAGLGSNSSLLTSNSRQPVLFQACLPRLARDRLVSGFVGFLGSGFLGPA